MTLQLLFDTPGFTVTHDCRHKLLHVTWRGTYTAASAITHCYLLLDFVRTTCSTKIFNDSAEVFDGWQEASQWVGKDFFQILGQAGVEAIAWVTAMDWPARTCIELAMNHAQALPVATFEFDQEQAARSWLLSIR
ncbi:MULTISPECIES: STAS/SEC14 domain-containing protein [Hymenobacter]|uniref:SpoIIAA-like n=1 Tax=Hymenobacter mucosus TaxID=1411120 RepID=A0A238ZI20_9BACT|nr:MULTISPECIES: STAS/SEC14 domain-containing protein [Hymenobacter]SNR83106.1 SpoIIAA-like [Hymenobacter mucosus]